MKQPPDAQHTLRRLDPRTSGPPLRARAVRFQPHDRGTSALRLLSYENVGEIEKRRIIDLFGLHHARSTAMRRRLQ
jgi:hypothetical protein